MPVEPVTRITAVRSEYTSARHICANLEHRAVGGRYERPAGYLAPEIDYHTDGGEPITIRVRDYDVRFLERVETREAVRHLDTIHQARHGDPRARAALNQLAHRLQPETSARFVKGDLIEDEHVIPYTTERDLPETLISSKGKVLLDLSRQGFATPDFTFLTSEVYALEQEQRRHQSRRAVRNLEVLSGRRLGDPANPLLIALRTAMPRYLPGFMPTYLNVGMVPAVLPGLAPRYGEEAAARIQLNNRRTLLEVVDPEAFAAHEEDIRHDLSRTTNLEITAELEALIAAHDERLLDDPWHQIDVCIAAAYDYYDQHFDALRNFMDDEVRYPTVIVQRMVCSVLDRDSYAGVLYSRHPRRGQGVHLQYARTIYGEDLMTGRLVPDEMHLLEREHARAEFPAVHHFWPRLAQLERIFAGPVMVEFTGVHGTFTILQVNHAQLAGAGMLTAVMDLYRGGEIDETRVRELIEPFHLRQLESAAIDPRSLGDLTPFARGLSVLPRTAVSGRLALSQAAAARLRHRRDDHRVVLCQERFTPTDTVAMQSVDGIVSLSPAAIHVVTTAQTMGIASLLDLGRAGVRISEDGRALINGAGERLEEGAWVTISSRQKSLFAGQAVFTAARLMRYLEGEPLELTGEEQQRFAALARDYRTYHEVVAGSAAADFRSLQEVGRAVRSGVLRGDANRAREMAQRAVDRRGDALVEVLLETTLGMHLNNQTAFRLLDAPRQVRLLQRVATLARERGLAGFRAGAFVVGSLVVTDLTSDQWDLLDAPTAAFLVNEWVLHRKYRDLLADVGERRLNRARNVVLTEGLGDLSLHPGILTTLKALARSGHDPRDLIEALPEGADPQTADVLRLLADGGHGR